MQVILLSVLRQSALLQLRLHSRLNTWFQLISHRQLQGETGNIQVERVGAPHISDWTVVISHQRDLLTIIEDNPIQLPIWRPWWGYSHLFKVMSRSNYRNGINKFLFTDPGWSIYFSETWTINGLGNDHWGQSKFNCQFDGRGEGKGINKFLFTDPGWTYICQWYGLLMVWVMIIEDKLIQLPIWRPRWGYSYLFKDMSRLNYRNGINKFLFTDPGWSIYLSVIWASTGLGNDNHLWGAETTTNTYKTHT